MKRYFLLIPCLLAWQLACCWGFYGHRQINYFAVFLLPPELIRFYKPHLSFLSEHAVDPDKRRYLLEEEGPRHFIDLDRYPHPDSLPLTWEGAKARFPPDTLQALGIVPWWVQVVHRRLTAAFKEKDGARILRLSAEIGHYLADAHVPLHASSNHNGQHTGQHGIHGFWESRVPELLAEKEWSFLVGRASYLPHPGHFIWERVRESAAAADTVLRVERELTRRFPPEAKFAYELRSGKTVRQYSSRFTRAYDAALGGMVERRMRQSIFAVASFWYTAWVDAGQPALVPAALPEEEARARQELEAAWRKGAMKGRGE
jgi:hypothetical protein